MNMKKILAGLIFTSSGLFTVGASAALVTNWDWTSDGGFVTGAATCSNGAEAACNLQYDNASGVTPSGVAGTASVMTWGTPSTSPGANGNQSGLQGVFGASGAGPYDAQLLGSGPIAIPLFPQLITNNGWSNTGAAVHYNNIITSNGGHMDTSKLTTTFQLLAPLAGPVNSTDIDIEFLESNNTAPCPGANPHGTVCDDVFSVSSLPPPIVFMYDGITYTLSFQFADGPGAIVDGNTIYTAEEAPGTAVMFVQARIDARVIPVPGVLALMGMGLILLGWRVRGRKAY
ncbi:MAG: THxN family PEP-CTERM protein [Porticoccaceae bacterium]